MDGIELSVWGTKNQTLSLVQVDFSSIKWKLLCNKAK